MNADPASARRRRGHRVRAAARMAFSLVEVTLALGIASFAIVLLVALLPVGIRSTRDSLEEGDALNVIAAVVADRQATPYNTASTLYQLPALTPGMTGSSNYFGVSKDNEAIPSSNAAGLTTARFRVDYRLTPPAAGTLAPFVCHLKVGWPASSVTPATVETVVTFAQP